MAPRVWVIRPAHLVFDGVIFTPSNPLPRHFLVIGPRPPALAPFSCCNQSTSHIQPRAKRYFVSSAPSMPPFFASFLVPISKPARYYDLLEGSVMSASTAKPCHLPHGTARHCDSTRPAVGELARSAPSMVGDGVDGRGETIPTVTDASILLLTTYSRSRTTGCFPNRIWQSAASKRRRDRDCVGCLHQLGSHLRTRRGPGGSSAIHSTSRGGRGCQGCRAIPGSGKASCCCRPQILGLAP